MEKGMLVLVMNPADPQLADVSCAGYKPTFGIIIGVLGYSRRYLEHMCDVRRDDGTTEVLSAGRLAPLLLLPEEDAQEMTPKEAFAKWTDKITERQAILHLSHAQRIFLCNLNPANR